jgi:hypothetical protein
MCRNLFSIMVLRWNKTVGSGPFVADRDAGNVRCTSRVAKGRTTHDVAPLVRNMRPTDSKNKLLSMCQPRAAGLQTWAVN